MYQLRKPASALARFVEHYWFVTSDDGPLDLRVDVFVDGRADLVFNFGVPYLREVIGRSPIEHAASNLDAQRLDPIRITQRGLVRITGVRFRLGGLGAFSALPLRPWTNTTPPPVELLPGADALETALGSAGIDEQASLLDAFLLGRLVSDPSHVAFMRACSTMEQTNDDGSVASVASASGVSARQLDRLFARYLGIPPKTVVRILRFQRTLRALMEDPGCALADVAARAGYFDQAHFIKDFKRFSGGVPRGYRGYYPPASPRDFAPNVVVFLQDASRRSRSL